ncbi:MAG TPA: TetR/AcrR family transcriptional regulator [Gemmatimonadales bacterium]|jgi:AcrR family transcriptional regulator
MVKRATDRRVQRTRQLLQDALIAMMIEKGYEATTVQDIIDRANVGRATFYAHFADKDTLLASRLEDLRSFLGERQRQAPGSFGFSLAMLDHARSHVPVWRAIVGRESGALVLQRVQSMIADLAGSDLKALSFAGTRAQRDLAVQYIAGAFMAVLTWWLDRGANLSPEEVDAIFRRLVMEGVAGEWGLRAPVKGKAPHLKSI